MKKIVPVGLTSNVYQKVYSIIFLLHIYIILNTINSLFFAGFQFQTKLKTPQFRPFNIKSLIRNLTVSPPSRNVHLIVHLKIGSYLAQIQR